jgi:hypothetical protein
VTGIGEVIGGAILSALVRIRAGLVIASAAFLELALAAGNGSKSFEPPLINFFVIISIIFGCGAVASMTIFLIDQFIRLWQR